MFKMLPLTWIQVQVSEDSSKVHMNLTIEWRKSSKALRTNTTSKNNKEVNSTTTSRDRSTPNKFSNSYNHELSLIIWSKQENNLRFTPLRDCSTNRWRRCRETDSLNVRMSIWPRFAIKVRTSNSTGQRCSMKSISQRQPTTKRYHRLVAHMQTKWTPHYARNHALQLEPRFNQRCNKLRSKDPTIQDNQSTPLLQHQALWQGCMEIQQSTHLNNHNRTWITYTSSSTRLNHAETPNTWSRTQRGHSQWTTDPSEGQQELRRLSRADLTKVYHQLKHRWLLNQSHASKQSQPLRTLYHKQNQSKIEPRLVSPETREMLALLPQRSVMWRLTLTSLSWDQLRTGLQQSNHCLQVQERQEALEARRCSIRRNCRLKAQDSSQMESTSLQKTWWKKLSNSTGPSPIQVYSSSAVRQISTSDTWSLRRTCSKSAASSQITSPWHRDNLAIPTHARMNLRKPFRHSDVHLNLTLLHWLQLKLESCIRRKVNSHKLLTSSRMLSTWQQLMSSMSALKNFQTYTSTESKSTSRWSSSSMQRLTTRRSLKQTQASSRDRSLSRLEHRTLFRTLLRFDSYLIT